MRDAFIPSRRTFIAGAAALAATPLPALAAGPPERPNLKIGLALNAATFMPLYLSAAKTAKDEGLNVQVIPFRGDAEVAQALVGDSIDISAQSLTGLLNMVTSNQGVIGFYSGFYQANFSWLAIPSIKSWADLKGKSMGISTFGSETDALTRHALQRHGLVPEKDVQMVQAGGSPSAIQALRAGRLTASILTAPFKWQAQEEGMTLLGTQAQEVSPQWPIHMIMAKTSFLAANPNTIVAVLRAHVNAIRLARSNKDFAASVLMDQLKLTKANADRSWDEIVPGYNERGTLPDKGMPAFWQIAEADGTVKAPLPVDKFLDQRWIKTYSQWAPK
jgi:NitT/TauT family transport system substrate-binding protein